MALQQGREVYVRYAGHPLYHRRHLVARVEWATWVVLTPDFDLYLEELSLRNEDLADVRVIPEDGRPPVGLEGVEAYNLREPIPPNLLE
eukprot:10268196-Lingulodinium_polyedra.AAC.1